MLSKSCFPVVAALASAVFAQTTYTLSGCHAHDGTEYCYLPNGSEVPFTRSATQTTTRTSQVTGPAQTVATATTAAIVPASVTGCHAHETKQYCLASGTEWEVLQTPSITPLPTSYSGCHGHGADVYCLAPDGSEVPIALEASSEDAGTVTNANDTSSTSGLDCHFHAGVEHCVGAGQSEGSSTRMCGRVERDYDIGLRVGLIFVVLIASAFAVFSPLFLERFTKMSLNSLLFTGLKQFGTGVVIATGFIHLLTHAELMFANECLGELAFEATATSIAMAGVFLSFLVEYIGNRLIMRRDKQSQSAQIVSEQLSNEIAKSEETRVDTHPDTSFAALGHSHSGAFGPDNHFNVAVMESGIVFHSILIGITLNVTPDSYYVTLFVVILFHQMFEGLALGTRIASLSDTTSTTTKVAMASLFTLITPIGMAIGTGVLSHFNGNDPSTIVAIGTLDALSAGILLWVGLVEMLAHDWMHGDMARAEPLKTVIGMVSFVIGMALMGLLGKWA